jgi:hypothetical protein
VPIIERVARRMRRKMVSLSERKKSKRIRRNPFSFTLFVSFDSFIMFLLKY